MSGIDISTTEKIKAILGLTAAISRFIGAAFYAALNGRKITTTAVIRAVNCFFNGLNPEQMQWALPSTAELYGQLIGSKSFKLPSGAQGYWIGSEKSQRVIVYFHGGGYACPASQSHIWWLASLKDALQDVSVLLVSYDLTPHARYPTQLKQAVSMVQYLIDDGLNPSQIILGGDSAGGNLAIAVLSHIMHPHLAIPALKIEEPLLGAFLVSPWTSFDVQKLHLADAQWDMLDANILSKATDAFLAGTKDQYNEPNSADGQWWSPLSKTIKHMFVWYGADEVLRGPIEEFISHVAPSMDITTVKAPEIGHVGIIMDHFLPFLQHTSDPSLLIWLQGVINA